MNKKFYMETYGCQLNVAGSEVVTAILENSGYERTRGREKRSIVNTCPVHENEK